MRDSVSRKVQTVDGREFYVKRYAVAVELAPNDLRSYDDWNHQIEKFRDLNNRIAGKDLVWWLKNKGVAVIGVSKNDTSRLVKYLERLNKPVRISTQDRLRIAKVQEHVDRASRK